MKLREYFLCIKKQQKTLYSTISSLFCQTSMRIHESATIQACGVADAGSGMLTEITFVLQLVCKQKNLHACVMVLAFLICVPKMNKGLTGLERHERN